jgi:transcriptional regulator with XRE-family HTH domain
VGKNKKELQYITVGYIMASNEEEVVRLDFKERLIALRAESGFSQNVLAEKLGVTQAAIWQWENDRRGPSLEMAGKIADFFCVSLDYLMGRSDERLYKTTWVGEDGETYTAWGQNKSPTNADREAAEKAVGDATNQQGLSVEDLEKIPGLSDYILRIVRGAENKTQGKG